MAIVNTLLPLMAIALVILAGSVVDFSAGSSRAQGTHVDSLGGQLFTTQMRPSSNRNNDGMAVGGRISNGAV
jgi:hypothetical protein